MAEAEESSGFFSAAGVADEAERESSFNEADVLTDDSIFEVSLVCKGMPVFTVGSVGLLEDVTIGAGLLEPCIFSGTMLVSFGFVSLTWDDDPVVIPPVEALDDSEVGGV